MERFSRDLRDITGLSGQEGVEALLVPIAFKVPCPPLSLFFYSLTFSPFAKQKCSMALATPSSTLLVVM